MPDVIVPNVQPKETRLIHWRMMVQSWLHSRKALLLLITWVFSCVALWAGKLASPDWVCIVKWSLASYLAANVGDSFADVLRGKNQNQ